MALTTETVADAAMRILADFGLGDLTMRRLARDLGVQPSALYWHVADKQSLLVLLAGRMAAQADDLARRTPDQDRLTSTIDAIAAYRDVLLRYRESADIVLLAYAHSGRSVLPAVLTDLDEVVRGSVIPFVLGSIAIQQNRHLVADDHAPPSRTPGGPDEHAEASFRTGLTRLLTP
ncbi:MAG TPA: TetR family transcriptional regulator [Brevibacterium sp.]|nr:TetR family transcriptional regulator [Brevibacterium sp.]